MGLWPRPCTKGRHGCHCAMAGTKLAPRQPHWHAGWRVGPHRGLHWGQRGRRARAKHTAKHLAKHLAKPLPQPRHTACRHCCTGISLRWR